MKEWLQNLIGAFILLMIGLVIFIYAININVPSAYKTFLGIPYQVNPEYVPSLGMLLIFSALGLFTIGMSLGSICTTYSIYKVERKLEQQPQIMTTTTMPISAEKRYCQYCGTENGKDFLFCKKCGNKLAQ